MVLKGTKGPPLALLLLCVLWSVLKSANSCSVKVPTGSGCHVVLTPVVHVSVDPLSASSLSACPHAFCCLCLLFGCLCQQKTQAAILRTARPQLATRQPIGFTDTLRVSTPKPSVPVSVKPNFSHLLPMVPGRSTISDHASSEVCGPVVWKRRRTVAATSAPCLCSTTTLQLCWCLPQQMPGWMCMQHRMRCRALGLCVLTRKRVGFSVAVFVDLLACCCCRNFSALLCR